MCIVFKRGFYGYFMCRIKKTIKYKLYYVFLKSNCMS